MGSRRLVRRAILLGVWVGGILLLLDIREPGFWREAMGVARNVVHEGESGSGERVGGSATAIVPEATTSPGAAQAPGPVLAVVEPVATPAPAAAAAVATPAPVEIARAPDVRASRPSQAAAPSRDLYARVSEAWRLNGSGDYAAAWRVARTLPDQAATTRFCA